jgi:predicted aminopeptidase
VVTLAAALACGGCRAAYVGRLAYEEARFLCSARPATELLASAQNPEKRKALEALLDVRDFAAREGLDVGGSYREVADVASASPFHVVTAAWADRLEPYTWWYPVVGAIPYRGYFDRQSADAFAAELSKEGYDTLVVEASAYSTLGWFDDPLPSSVLDRGDGAVVVTVLHELVHQTFFAAGQVAFNETLATDISWRLAEKYFAAKGEDARAAKARAAHEAFLARSDVLDAAAARLRAFFDEARAKGEPRDAMLAARAVLYGEVLADVTRVDPGFAKDLAGGRLDNASFLAAHRYASGARSIDAFVAASPDVAGALRRLKEAQARKADIVAFVAASTAPAPAS